MPCFISVLSNNMDAKDFLFGKECREKLFKGVEIANKTVGATLGPFGRNAGIDRIFVTQLTKDGVTVMQDVKCVDTFEDMGARLVKEASTKTNDEAGDGTTTAIVLAHAMIEYGLSKIDDKTNVIKVRKGMKKAIDVCVKKLEEMSIPAKTESDFRKIAAISSQDENIGKLVADIYKRSGEHGAISIERNEEPKIETEHTDGFQLERGWIHPDFINSSDLESILENVPVLVTDREISINEEIAPVCEELMKKGVKRMFILADKVTAQALATMLENTKRRIFLFCAVHCPSYGENRMEIFKDVCALTGATFISEESGIMLNQVTSEHLGMARKTVAKKDKTVIISKDQQQSIFERVGKIKDALEKEPPDSLERRQLEQRLACLTDGVSVIKVGATTEIERHELKHRVEDAVKAVKSASEEGMSAGGGISLIRCIDAVQAIPATGYELLGVQIVAKSLESPLRRMLEVAGIEDSSYIISKVKEAKGNVGYDFESDSLKDMVKLGILDAKKVVRCALENAASCAMSFLTLDVAIARHPEESKEKSGSSNTPQ